MGGGSILELGGGGGGSILELGGGGRVCWSVFSGSKVDVFY